MARCNDIYFNKVSKAKYDPSTEISINLLSDLASCKRINTKNFYATNDSNAVYRKYDRPDNFFECRKNGCVNSGTLYADKTGAAFVYHLPYDATQFAAGIVTFYVKASRELVGALENEDPNKFILDVTISEMADFENADTYTVTYDTGSAFADGYIPVVIDLTATPTKTAGNGWNPATTGAYLKIAENENSDTGIAISSIAIFDSIEDFEINDVIKISCVSEITNDIQADIAEETCNVNGYDQTSNPTIEYSITGKKVTPNWWKLNPLSGKGTATEGFTIPVEKHTAVFRTVNGNIYAAIALPNAFQKECGFIGLQFADTCDATESELTRVMARGDSIADGNFYVEADTVTQVTYIYVNVDFAGKEFLVTYPQKVDAEERVANIGNLGKKRARISFPYKTSDGQEYNVIYNNCLVTSFPMGISSDENDIEITFNVQPDEDGSYYHEYRILK